MRNGSILGGMTMLRRITLASALSAGVLVGCAPSMPILTEAEVQSISNTDSLCQLFHTLHEAQSQSDQASANMAVVRTELIRRGATSQSEWELTDAGKIQTGMHKCIVFALFGAPVMTSINGAVTYYQFPSADIVILQGDVVTSFTVVNPH